MWCVHFSDFFENQVVLPAANLFLFRDFAIRIFYWGAERGGILIVVGFLQHFVNLWILTNIWFPQQKTCEWAATKVVVASPVTTKLLLSQWATFLFRLEQVLRESGLSEMRNGCLRAMQSRDGNSLTHSGRSDPRFSSFIIWTFSCCHPRLKDKFSATTKVQGPS